MVLSGKSGKMSCFLPVGIVVEFFARQSFEIFQMVFTRQEPEHVVEGTILHHEHHDVLDTSRRFRHGGAYWQKADGVCPDGKPMFSKRPSAALKAAVHCANAGSESFRVWQQF